MALEKVLFVHKTKKGQTKELEIKHAVAFILQMQAMKKSNYILHQDYSFDGKDIILVKKAKDKND